MVYEQVLSHEVVLGNRVYQNPLKYYQIQDNISLDGGDYALSEGYEGLKTAKVIQALGLGNAVGMNGALYTSEVADKVADYQAQHGLDATGTVDLTTWLAMGLSEEDWYTLGAYVSPLRIDNTSSRTACIEAMISRAYDYLGDNYVIGASGAPGLGIDCSGLIMQALYAAGIDMSPINPVRHASPGYEYESANIWASSKFKHVDYKERRRGDIIIYCNEKGTVIHSAIYLGDDKVIEAWPNQVTESVFLPISIPWLKVLSGPLFKAKVSENKAAMDYSIAALFSENPNHLINGFQCISQTIILLSNLLVHCLAACNFAAAELLRQSSTDFIELIKSKIEANAFHRMCSTKSIFTIPRF